MVHPIQRSHHHRPLHDRRNADELQNSDSSGPFTGRNHRPGPDGALWFTDGGANAIGRITTAGAITEFPISVSSGAAFITTGPDGALWFTESGCQTCSPVVAGVIGRITTAGDITEFPVAAGVTPSRITLGPDGALWFTINAVSGVQSTVGRITTAGTVTQLPIAIPGDGEITVGPDGALWFAETTVSCPVRRPISGGLRRQGSKRIMRRRTRRQYVVRRDLSGQYRPPRAAREEPASECRGPGYGHRRVSRRRLHDDLRQQHFCRPVGTADSEPE